VDRQVRLEVDGDEFFVDLLLFHLEQLRYVVVELKIGKFEPAHLGQLGFYVSVIDHQRRNPNRHAPTVGILVCTQGKEQVVRFALGSATAPMAVATYTYDTLPATERAALPTAEDLASAVTPTPALVGMFAQQLLKQLATINPNLDHPRSIARARNTLLDIRQGKPEQMLIGNTAQRFSNEHSVQLDDQEAQRILHIVRSLYEAQSVAYPSGIEHDPAT